MSRLIVAGVALSLIAQTSVAQERSFHGLSVSVALSDPARRVAYRQTGDHFHVILSNAAPRAQRVFQDWNSWGYYSLSFELEDMSGRRWVAKKKQVPFSKNFPSVWEILPGNNLVIDVYWGDEDTWQGFPPFGTESRKVKIRAIFEVKPDPETKRYDVWTGRIVSSAQEVEFSKWKPEK
jgi:hypothetical protein